jgi:hypothetical protein
MKSRAAVAFGPGQPLKIVEIDVAPPKKGEVLVKITHTGVCHTDAFTKASPACSLAITLSRCIPQSAASANSVNPVKLTSARQYVPPRGKV